MKRHHHTAIDRCLHCERRFARLPKQVEDDPANAMSLDHVGATIVSLSQMLPKMIGYSIPLLGICVESVRHTGLYTKGR